MKAKYWNIFFIFLLLLDIGYTFYQNLNVPLLGDVADIVLPSQYNQAVLKDPLGINVFFYKESYIGAGRFFAHWTTSKYLKTFPFLFQTFATPIESVYLSCAFAKTAIQLLLISVISAFVYFSQKKEKRNFLFSMVLITPLFQTEGFNRYMNIINKSIVYSFFYPLFLGILAIYFLLFFKYLYNEEKLSFNLPTKILLLFLSFVVTLSCPLNTGIILIACPMILFSAFYQNFAQISGSFSFQKIFISLQKIQKPLLIFFITLCLLSFYSFYIGKNNAESFNYEVSIWQRYARLPAGLYFVLFSKLGFPLLMLLIIVNVFLLKKQNENLQARKILTLMKWLGIFSILYILLLPLGGTRVYRPNIIRGDTFMPVTLVMIFAYAISSHFLINTIFDKTKKLYLAGIALFLFIFTISDEPIIENNQCERAALKQISTSKDSVVVLHSDCAIMAWNKFVLPEHSSANSQMFQYWGITSQYRPFYHANP